MMRELGGVFYNFCKNYTMTSMMCRVSGLGWGWRKAERGSQQKPVPGFYLINSNVFLRPFDFLKISHSLCLECLIK